MPMVNEAEARVNRTRAETLLHAVKALEVEGNSRASEVLDFYEEYRINPNGSENFLPVLNKFIANHNRVLFKDEEEICGVSTGRLTVMFPDYNTVTFKYGIGENNFGAIGITYKLLVDVLSPLYIQVHDRTGHQIPIDYFDEDNELEKIVEYAFSFMKTEGDVVAYPAHEDNNKKIMSYPLIDPRISLHLDNCDSEQHLKTREAFLGVLRVVEELAPNTHSMITGTWNGSHNIDTDVFRLRTYDYHDDDETLTWNFVWRDVAVQWYKHPGRCLTINRLLSDEELSEMSEEIIKALSTYEFEQEPEKWVGGLNHDPDLIALKLMNNSRSGAMSTSALTLQSGVAGEQMLTEILQARKERKKRLLGK